MKPLHSARHATEAHLICGFLQSNGIAAEVRGEFLAGGFGELPAGLCQVWIIDDALYAHADRLVRQFLHGESASDPASSPWVCPRCNESLEAQFTDCWKCGSTRQAT